MKLLPLAKSWRNGLLIMFGLFLLSRVLMLKTFPIFNDETIYLQYAQQIHEDWQKNKFISMHGEFTDWKPPLMYWMAAPVIDWGNDPLVAGRAVALIVSIAGFFGFYLFARELFGEREGVISAALYLVCPPVLLHNNQFTAETFLFSTAPFFYWALLQTFDRARPKWWLWVAGAVLWGAALPLFKQSGFLLLAVAVFLPIARFRTNEPGNWKFLGRSFVLVVVVIVCSSLAANAILPAGFNATRDRFNSRWVLPLGEVLRFPWQIWRPNCGIVADYIGAYYTWLIALLFGGVSALALRKKHFPELALVCMCLAGAGGVIFFLKGFNEYLFNTAVIATLLPLLGRTGVRLWPPVANRTSPLPPIAILALGGVGLCNWFYQDILMAVSPGRYIERSTPWAVSNYLTRWSTGFGVIETVATLEGEKREGVVFIDAQWGNPGTALEVYRKKRFPNLRMVPVSREFLNEVETRKLKETALALAPVHLAIYSADRSGVRAQWQTQLERQMCEERREVKSYPAQTPIVLCSF